MKNELKIIGIQTALIWENPKTPKPQNPWNDCNIEVWSLLITDIKN